jgi:hypothetical protein
LVDLRALEPYDWRLSEGNVWKVERMLLDAKHRPIRTPDAHVRRLRAWYLAFKKQYPDRKPIDYPGRRKWTPIPREFLGIPDGGRRTVNRDRNRAWAG